MSSKMTGHLLFLTPYVRNLSMRSFIIHWSGRIEIFKGQLSQSFTEIVWYNPPFNENGISHGQQYRFHFRFSNCDPTSLSPSPLTTVNQPSYIMILFEQNSIAYRYNIPSDDGCC